MQKNNNLQARPNRGSLIKFDKSNKLLQDIEQSKMTHEEALKRINNICSVIKKIIDRENINLNQIRVINILFVVDEIFTGKIKNVEVNNDDILEVFEEKSERNKNLMNNQILQICLN